MKLDRRREECRQIVTRLLSSRLGKTELPLCESVTLTREMAGPPCRQPSQWPPNED